MLKVKEISLEFPEFITHVRQSKKKWIKIGYNKIYASPHWTVRDAYVAALHGYLEKHIPKNVVMETPVETHLIIYAPVNYGDVRRLTNRKTKKAYLSWKPPKEDYAPEWDLGNLAFMWLKALDDVLQKHDVIPDDNIQYLRKTTYEFVPVATLDERKLVYNLKTIK